MWDTSARLLRLLSLLQTPRTWSGAELAERLQVDARTVRRDIERLRTLGYPVHAAPGVAGYRLGTGASMPPLLLDDDEAVAVAVGLGTGAGGTVTGIAEASVRALAKLDQVLPSRLRHRVGSLRAATVAIPPGTPTVDPDVLTAIAAACGRHERLRFDYAGRDGTEMVRDTEPLRLVHGGRFWYLVAFDIGRSDWRTFRVDRLRPRIPTGPRFVPRPAPAEDVAGYVAEGISSRVYRYRAEFELHVPIAMAAERVPPTIGTLEATGPDSCRLRAGSNSLDELAIWVVTWGLPFDVLGPPELDRHMTTLAERMIRSTAAARSRRSDTPSADR